MFKFIEKIRQNHNKLRLNNKKFAFMFDENIAKDEFVALDTETTGLNPNKDEILSIGAVKIKGNKIITSKSFEIFVKPLYNISEESIKIHHILPHEIAQATTIDDALSKFLHFVQNRPIVGYYISFDEAIINNYLKQYVNITLPNETIELSSMYYKRYRKKSAHEFVDLKFDTIMQNLDIPTLGKHDALNDAIMSAMIYLKLKDKPIYKGAFR